MRGLTFALAIAVISARPTATVAQPSNPALNGNVYVAEVLKSLRLHGNIDAKLRYESKLYEQKLAGQGSYQQGGNLNKRFTRWEMQTQIADQTASFVQVYDGDHLWTERRLPSRREVNRLDVVRLQAGLRTHNRGVALDHRDQLLATVAGQGGLSQLLADLLVNFDFQPPQPTQLNGLPVNALVGTWRAEQLVKKWPASTQLDSDDPPPWPNQLPHHVLLLVRKENLFPCVLEHRPASSASYATSLAGLRPLDDPLLRYEIYEVNFAIAIPDEHFHFQPGESWSDETSVVLQQLTEQHTPPEAPSASQPTPQPEA